MIKKKRKDIGGEKKNVSIEKCHDNDNSGDFTSLCGLRPVMVV